MRTISDELYGRAQIKIPGGVNSPVRAFKAVGGNPIFIARGSGCRVYDVDGNEYVDFLASWGPMILGHAHPAIVAAIEKAATEGMSFGATTEREVLMAERLCEAIPSMDMVRMVNSGTEAVMSAIRLARAYTGKEMIIKFDGGYHGHSDSLLVQAGSGVATLGIPGSQGVPSALTSLTLSLPYNDEESLKNAFAKYDGRIACVILEPIAGNMGLVKGTRNFLQTARDLTSSSNALLIFDEIITGFRLAYGGYQDVIGIVPDLTCLGKIIGGGLPVGALGGRRDIMNLLAPLGGVYQAGTLSGNPLAMAAGMATVELLDEMRHHYELLERTTFAFCQELLEAFTEYAIPVRINQAGSMFTCFLTDTDVKDFASAKRADTDTYAKIFRLALDGGVYLPPAQFEAAFVSFVHGNSDIWEALDRLRKAIRLLRQ